MIQWLKILHNKLDEILAHLRWYLKALKDSKEVYLEARNLKGEYNQLKEDYQTLEHQLDELLSKESETDERIEKIKADYQQIIDTYKDYQEKMQSYRWAFEHIEYFSREMEIEAKTKLWALSDTIIDVLVDFLKYYKFDLAQKSLSLAKIDQNQQWRAWAISTIDAMIIFLNKQRKKKNYTDRITWTQKDT